MTWHDMLLDLREQSWGNIELREHRADPCSTRFSHDSTLATWVYMLETVCGTVGRLGKNLRLHPLMSLLLSFKDWEHCKLATSPSVESAESHLICFHRAERVVWTLTESHLIRFHRAERVAWTLTESHLIRFHRAERVAWTLTVSPNPFSQGWNVNTNSLTWSVFIGLKEWREHWQSLSHLIRFHRAERVAWTLGALRWLTPCQWTGTNVWNTSRKMNPTYRVCF